MSGALADLLDGIVLATSAAFDLARACRDPGCTEDISMEEHDTSCASCAVRQVLICLCLAADASGGAHLDSMRAHLAQASRSLRDYRNNLSVEDL